MKQKSASVADKVFREQDKKAARDDADKAKSATRLKTSKLKALRLAKEASDIATAEAAAPGKAAKKRAVRKPALVVPARRRG